MSLFYYIRRARELGIAETFLQAREIGLNRASSVLRRAYDRHLRKEMDERSVLERSGFRSASELLANFKERISPRFFFDRELRSRIEEFRRYFPAEAVAIIEAAEHVLQHKLDILGSGLTDLSEYVARSLKTIQPNGSIKSDRTPGYLPWHVDFKSGFAWARGTYYKDVKYGHMPGLDVKVPWELSRFHHLIQLGQAYQLTSREYYAQEFKRQIEDWIATNPCRYGVNWSCTMEVGIRAVNWIWAFHFFIQSPHVDETFLLRFLTSLNSHAGFIFSNLEFREAWVNGDRRRLNSNHYLGDIVGLLYIALLFPELKLKSHFEFACDELETELLSETAEDGADYEHSVHYHRLVLEIFLSGFYLLHLNGHRLKRNLEERLIKMAEFVADYSRSDGSVPQIGDNDSGRLHALSITQASDHRYLPSIAAEMFSRPSLKRGPAHSEVWWWYGSVSDTIESKRTSAAYLDAGFFVLRTDEVHVFISAATVGMFGLGSHSHNDLFSFEYWSQGQAWIVDPGTYLYTPDPASRNLFRSTEYHNGVRIDGKEINPMRAGQLFQLSDLAQVTLHEWTSNDEVDVLDVEHNGYLRADIGVRHRRKFQFHKSVGKLLVLDSFEGTGNHTLEWRLHLHPSVTTELRGSSALLKSGNVQVLLDLPAGLAFETSNGWYSPSYGVRSPSPVLILSKTGETPESTWISITPGS